MSAQPRLGMSSGRLASRPRPGSEARFWAVPSATWSAARVSTERQSCPGASSSAMGASPISSRRCPGETTTVRNGEERRLPKMSRDCRSWLPSEPSPPVCGCPTIGSVCLTQGWAFRRTRVTPLDIFMDAEFNGFGGDLISIALVCADGQEWYEVAEVPAEPHPFVVEHVLPVLGKAGSLCAVLGGVSGQRTGAGHRRGLAR